MDQPRELLFELKTAHLKLRPEDVEITEHGIKVFAPLNLCHCGGLRSGQAVDPPALFRTTSLERPSPARASDAYLRAKPRAESMAVRSETKDRLNIGPPHDLEMERRAVEPPKQKPML